MLFVVGDPGKTYPGSRGQKAPDPGSGSATLSISIALHQIISLVYLLLPVVLLHASQMAEDDVLYPGGYKEMSSILAD